jgi:hypothetical protein
MRKFAVVWRCLKTTRLLQLELAGHGVKFMAEAIIADCKINEAHPESPPALYCVSTQSSQPLLSAHHRRADMICRLFFYYPIL